MTKAEFIDALASKTGESKADAAKNLDAVVDLLKDLFVKGDKLSLPGFGTFGTTVRGEKVGINPKTGEKLTIPARTVPKFKPSDKLVIKA